MSEASREETPRSWDKVLKLLEPWQEVWNGDRAQYEQQFPSWMLDAANELFAHDACDAWAWDEYVKAAATIIKRHYDAGAKASQEKVAELEADEAFWKKNALALVTLLRAKCSDDEWAKLNAMVDLPAAPGSPSVEEKGTK
jgi:hypothetical protein